MVAEIRIVVTFGKEGYTYKRKGYSGFVILVAFYFFIWVIVTWVCTLCENSVTLIGRIFTEIL